MRGTQGSSAAEAERNSTKIAQVAPLYEAVPPKLYGGTERVVANLAKRWSTWATTSPCSPPPTRRPGPSWSRCAIRRSGSTPRR